MTVTGLYRQKEKDGFIENTALRQKDKENLDGDDDVYYYNC